MESRQFRIDVPQADLDDLRRRLGATRYASELTNDGWDDGAEGKYLRELMTSWAEQFDWRAQERAMNAYDHFLVDIGGQPTHFLHAQRAGALPILLIHGWPQTFWDFAGVLPMLSEFELVVPDLPGHGFSMPLTRTGVGFVQASDMYHHLMTEVLGHRRYGVYGTDWGALVGEHLALMHPEEVVGLHTTMPIPLGFSPRNRDRAASWAPDEHRRRKAAQAQADTGSGYLLMHVHRPQTVACLGDSPLAMAAWIVDKVHAWTDHDGNVETAYPRDRLLTTLSLYWLTNSLGPSARFYAESFREPWQPPADRQPMITVPTAVAAYPNESGAYPRRWVEQYFNLHRYTIMDRGGHFPAVENPESLGTDIAAFFRSLPGGARSAAPSSSLESSVSFPGSYEPSSSEVTRNQVELYERSGGRDGTTVAGVPVVVLTTVGAKSGKIRKTAVMRVEHEGVYAVVGSLAGAPRDPLWCGNLRAHPRAEVQDGPARYSVVAHEAKDDEREVWWARAVAAWPAYDEYQAKAGRVIPVMVLEPDTGARGHVTRSGSRVADWTLWAGTIGLDSAISDRIHAATATGCNRISIGPLDLAREGTRSSARELGARIRDAGLQTVVDPIWNWYPAEDARPTPFADFTVTETLDVAADLGAVAATAVSQMRQYLGDREHRARETNVWQPAIGLLTEHFGQLCDRAADVGLAVNLEFMPMTDVQDLAMAWDIVRQAGRGNGGIVLDSWHFFRGRPDFDLLSRVPGARIGMVQLSDARPEVSGTLFQDVRRRLLPGDGSFDLVRLIRLLADTGGLSSVGPEVINPDLSGRPAVETARTACDRVRELIAGALASDQASGSRP